MPSSPTAVYGRLIAGISLTLSIAGVHGQEAMVRDWTVMVYMNAKNNLEPFALDNFHSMAVVGSSPEVNVVAQLGRPQCDRAAKPSTCYTTADGNWSGVHRFLVGKGTNPLPVEAKVDVAAIGESTDMGSPQALAQFIQWSRKAYPAKRYMLVIWNHGQGWRFQLSANQALRNRSVRSPLSNEVLQSVPATTPGVGGFRAVSSDDDTNSILYNSEVQKVIAGEFSKAKLDLLGYDACLMGMVETAYGLVPSVEVMVASEELEPGSGWRYSTWLDKLVANPSMGPEDLSKALVDSYRQQYGDEHLTTLSSIRLSNIPGVAQSISALADGIGKAGDVELAAMRNARRDVEAYGASVTPPLRTSVDIAALLKAYERNTSNADLRSKAVNVRSLMGKAVVANYASARSQYPKDYIPYGSEGLAIYYPDSSGAFYNDHFHKGYLKANQDRPVDFVQKESWADLLYKLLGI